MLYCKQYFFIFVKINQNQTPQIMKKILLSACFFVATIAFSQEHFSGFTTSKRVGLLNAGINPSELVNLKSKFDVQLFAISTNISNNKIGFKDLVDGTNIEKKIFSGNETVNFNIDAEILGPGFAFNLLGWGFGIQTKSYLKANVIDVDSNLGNALSNSGANLVLGSATINNNFNQRVNGVAWGEVSLMGAKKLYENKKHKFSGGIALKILFPASYANLGLDQFKGRITSTAGQVYLSDAQANLNIAYSGNLGENFGNVSDYTKSLFGGINGFAGDLGVNYILKSTLSDYKLKVGLSVRNIGSMTFKADNNQSTSYRLNIPAGNLGLALNQFNGNESLKDIEAKLLASNFLIKGEQNKDFTVKLPTVLNLYADLQIIPKLSITAFLQQRFNSKNDNNQVNSQNSYSLTPRFNIKIFEIFTPIVVNEVSGTNAGLGFRLGGFFMGSNSIITSLSSNAKQADFYAGFRFGIL